MKRRQSRRTTSADLLVCFHPRNHHLTLTNPNPIPSPARPNDPNRTTCRRPSFSHLTRSHTRRASSGGSPDFLAGQKTRLGREEELSEPSSPKVTCSGQIKVRRRSGSCRNWNSVMHEIEKIHRDRNNNNQKKNENNNNKNKKPGWAESTRQFVACLRSFKLDLRCFGSGTVACSDDEEEEDEVRKKEKDRIEEEESRDVFSDHWLMILNENDNNEEKLEEKDRSLDDDYDSGANDDDRVDDGVKGGPPANALLLMRCRSAPGRSRFEERHEKMGFEGENYGKKMEEEDSKIGEKKKERESLAILMRYDDDDAGFEKMSSDIAKETWVLSGLNDPLSRSRSWKR